MAVDQTEFQNRLDTVICSILEIRNFAKKYDLINSEEYLDFEDKLNKISTMDPNN